MRVIKFKLLLGHNFIETDNTYLEPTWIEWQGDGFVVWCKEFTSMGNWQKPLELYLATTGELVPDSYAYVGTATDPDRTFVVHLFQLPWVFNN